MTKSAAALVLVLCLIIGFPVIIAIGATFFGVIVGLFGTIIGVLGGVFGAFFGVIGGILGSGWVPVLIVAVLVAAALSRRR
jgi:hypothetical protein